MNDEQKELARRLAAHPRWVWRRGVLPVYECAPYVWRHERVEEDGWNPQYCDDIAMPNGWPDAKREAWPDLTDAATGGVLAGMLGPGWVFECCTSSGGATKWKAYLRGYILAKDAAVHCGATLAEACARALLAKWGE